VRELIEFRVENGGVIQAEVDIPDTQGGIARAGRSAEGVLNSTSKSFDAAVQAARPAAEAVMRSIQGMAIKPDEVTVEFGLKLSFQAGAIIAATATEGNFRVLVTWRSSGGDTKPANRND
jgi:hypothetical protein